MHNNINRRHLLTATAAAWLLPRQVWALTETSAQVLVETVVGKINQVISSGKSENAMLRDFEALFARYADVNIMAQYALGNDGRSASAAQKAAFTKAFQSYIARKYGRRFREFIGGRIEVRSARPIRAGFEIKSLAYIRGSAPFEVTFLVSNKSGSDLFFNIFIEGVNLLLAERTEIGAMLDRNKGSIDRLTAELRAGN